MTIIYTTFFGDQRRADWHFWYAVEEIPSVAFLADWERSEREEMKTFASQTTNLLLRHARTVICKHNERKSVDLRHVKKKSPSIEQKDFDCLAGSARPPVLEKSNISFGVRHSYSVRHILSTR
jgi:hypothetical protein